MTTSSLACAWYSLHLPLRTLSFLHPSFLESFILALRAASHNFTTQKSRKQYICLQCDAKSVFFFLILRFKNKTKNKKRNEERTRRDWSWADSYSFLTSRTTFSAFTFSGLIFPRLIRLGKKKNVYALSWQAPTAPLALNWNTIDDLTKQRRKDELRPEFKLISPRGFFSNWDQWRTPRAFNSIATRKDGLERNDLFQSRGFCSSLR